MSTIVDASSKQPLKETQKSLAVKEEAETAVADARILKTLAAYLWPKDNPEFRRRVAIALSLLVFSKVNDRSKSRNPVKIDCVQQGHTCL